jgi:hypothetical protein
MCADASAQATVQAGGSWPESAPQQFTLRHGADGIVTVVADGVSLWQGSLALQPGALGLWAGPASTADITRFAVTGEARPVWLPWLYTEALLGAGQSMTDWEERHDASFRYGVGVVSCRSTARAKWNFHGAGFRLWLPRGADYGSVRLTLDGVPLAECDLHATHAQPSAPLFTHSGLADGYHALMMEAERGRLVIDTLDVLVASHGGVP